MFDKKLSKLKFAQEKAEQTIALVNSKINDIGKSASKLYDSLFSLQELFDRISNVPTEKKRQYLELKAQCCSWKQQVDKIEADYKNSVVKNAGVGVAGVGVGVAVVTLGPTAAMGVATTFGVASTGTAISTLSGAAATNAALAWLGGGALAAGGGGMAAGNAFLALAGPVGWTIAGISLVSAGLLFWKSINDRKRLENVYTLIAERDTKSYELAILEINERISRINDWSDKLSFAYDEILTFGLDYDLMTENQQYYLGAYLNYMSAATQLLISPIVGLQTKYSEEDFANFIAAKNYTAYNKEVIMFLSNLLYDIPLDEYDKKLVWKSIRKNKDLLQSLNKTKESFTMYLIETACEALRFKSNK